MDRQNPIYSITVPATETSDTNDSEAEFVLEEAKDIVKQINGRRRCIVNLCEATMYHENRVALENKGYQVQGPFGLSGSSYYVIACSAHSEDRLNGFEERLKKMEHMLAEVYHAPGMPGFLEAEREFSNHITKKKKEHV